MGKRNKKDVDSKFIFILKECSRIHVKIENAIENQDVGLLKVLKTKLLEIEKSLECEYFELVEFDLDDKYYDEYTDRKDSILKLLVDIDAVTSDNKTKLSESNGINQSGYETRIKLPKFELPTFHGNFDCWLSFKEIFYSSIVQNSRLSEVDKFQYLFSSLKGQALQLVKGFPMTGANFSQAWETLEKRFDNPSELANSQINKFFNLKAIKSVSSKSLHEMSDVCNEALRNLKILGYERNSFVDLILINVLQSKIDDNLKQQFQLTLDSKDPPTFEQFMSFIDKHARSLHVVKEGCAKPEAVKSSGKKALVNSTVFKKSTNTCIMCNENHLLCKCNKFSMMPVEQRWDFVKMNGCCFNCLRSNHRVSQCLFSTGCKSCKQKHHTLLHKFQPLSQTSESVTHSLLNTCNNHINHLNSNTENSVQETIPKESLRCFSSTNRNCNVLLSTAMIKIKGKNGKIRPYRALIDNGSQKCLMSQKCFEELGLLGKKSVHTICGINDLVAETSLVETETTFSSHFNDKWIPLHAIVVNKVTTNLPNFRIPNRKWPHLENLLLADPEFMKCRPIDILLGADMYADLLIGNPIKGIEGSPCAINSKLGYLLCGKIEPQDEVQTSIINCLATVESDFQLQKFWELESLPKFRIASDEDKICEELFASSVKRDESGRYIVNLPFKPGFTLGETKTEALKRLKYLERKLYKNESLRKEYNSFLREYLELNHMELVQESPTGSNICYLPHHGVIKEDSTTTKLRVVFDASMKSSLGTSLNDSLFVGPKLQADLFSILIKFRCHAIALSADLEKMYRQIRVSKEHCDFQRILWRFSPDDPVDEYRLLTVTYGTASAPFLAIRTLQQLAKDETENFPDASKVTLTDFYVDDLLSGACSIPEAKGLVKELMALMNSGGFNLRKWTSNCEEVLDELPNSLKSVTPDVDIEENESHKVLGIKWNAKNDVLQIKFNIQKDVKTKRDLLSIIARIFDPLGFLSPATVVLKILLQDLWKDKAAWDDDLPVHILETWRKFQSEIHLLTKIQVPRFICSSSTVREIQLHGFSDASTKAYSAVCYLRTVFHSGECKVVLIASKTRVAPIKTVTLPRLELCAALLLSELCHLVLQSITFKISQIVCWSDSQIVLSWIKTEPSRLNVFVSHRIAKIQSSEPKSKWCHISGHENPADCASRGIMPEKLLNHKLWWTGPPWLSGNFQLPSEVEPRLSEEEMACVKEEIKSKPTVVNVTQIAPTPEFVEKFSSFGKLTRITAYVLRFIHNTRSPSNKFIGHLSVSEISQATNYIVRIIQKTEYLPEIKLLEKNLPLPKTSKIISLNPFLDSQGIIRVGGRLSHCNFLQFGQKHPMLLPRHHSVTKAIIRQCHEYLLHAGVQLSLANLRQKFWIPCGRSVIRKVIHNCITCFKFRAKPLNQLMGDLPASRFSSGRAFINVGVDFGGPFITKPNVPRSKITLKSYIALFICFATKAIHLEVVSELTSDAFLAALRRFMSRRGKPSNVYSDNATNFKGASAYLKEQTRLLKSSEIQNFVSSESIVWHFIPPSAPHFGGLWEAGIKATKQHLIKTCKSAILNFEELSTLVIQIEACLNSRPISPMSTDPNDLEPLTPGHFLIGAPLTSPPEQAPMLSISLKSRWHLIQNLRNQFWVRWRKEYLNNLQPRGKWTLSQNSVKVDDLVLLKDDSLPPLKWSLARVTKVFPGDDNRVRVVEVKTSSGHFRRPIAKCCLLPNQLS